MRLNASAGLDASVVVKFNARRLQLRIGPAHRITLTADEAIELATQLVDAVDKLRADTRNNQRTEPQP
jgi:hypothetical protein